MLYDAGLVGFLEPFARLFTQGMIYRNGAKMSKSKGNVIAPDELVERYGADTTRLYTLFMGPPEQDAEWNDEAVAGAYRFCERSWRTRPRDRRDAARGIVRDAGDPASLDAASLELARKAHWTIDKVTRDIAERLHFNTAIAACMELLNAVASSGEAAPAVRRFAAGVLCSLAQPFVPHLSEELWGRLGGSELWREPWPTADPRFLATDSATVVVQVNGKLRGRFDAPLGLDREARDRAGRGARERALAPRHRRGRQGGRGAGQARQLRGASPLDRSDSGTLSGRRRTTPARGLRAMLRGCRPTAASSCSPSSSAWWRWR